MSELDDLETDFATDKTLTTAKKARAGRRFWKGSRAGMQGRPTWQKQLIACRQRVPAAPITLAGDK